MSEPETEELFVYIGMTDNSHEISPTERNNHTSEVPMPEQKTGDVQPQTLPHMPGKESPDSNPSHPPSERA